MIVVIDTEKLKELNKPKDCTIEEAYGQCDGWINCCDKVEEIGKPVVEIVAELLAEDPFDEIWLEHCREFERILEGKK